MPQESASQVPPVLEARGLGRRHRDRIAWLVRDISLAIHAGDRVALTGPTGSGKTVLLRTLCLLDAVDEGAVIWKGESPRLDKIPVFRSQAIYLTQRTKLFEGTVEQNLRIPYSLTANRDRKYSQKNLEAYLQQLGRDVTFLTRDSAHLSGGETQIVAILRAIQLEPTVLLLDEPTASTDEVTARQIEQLVNDWMSLADTARAFVWVTHDAPQAERVANRTWQLRDGKLL